MLRRLTEPLMIGLFISSFSAPGCVTRGPIASDNAPVLVRTTAIGGGVSFVRDEPDGSRTGLFTPGRDEPRAHWKFIAWCASGGRPLAGGCESRNADGALTSSFPETGFVDDHLVHGWGCLYANVDPGDTVRVQVRCQ